MARPAARAIAIALLVALVTALAAACGGGGGDGGGADLTAGLTPAEILTKSVQATNDLEAFRISLKVTGRADVSSGAGLPQGLGGLLNGKIDLSGEGPVQPPDKAAIDARIGLGGIALQVNLTRVGDKVYLGALGQDFSLDLPPEQVGLLDLGELYPTLVDWTTEPTEAGTEDVNGDPTVKITGRLDPATALADLGPAIGAGQITPAQARRVLRTGTVEMWIGTQDLLPRRVHVVLDADGTGVLKGVGVVSADLTAEFSDFDQPVDIQAPANPRPLDPSQLGSLVGG